MSLLDILLVGPLMRIVSAAFFLTAHFSQEDYPYDWYVPVTRDRTVASVLLTMNSVLFRLLHWLSKVCIMYPQRTENIHVLRIPIVVVPLREWPDAIYVATFQLNSNRNFPGRTLTLHFHFFSQQPAWGQSREFEITTRSVGHSSITQKTAGDLEEEEEEGEDELVHGRRKRKVAFMPSLGTYRFSRMPVTLFFLRACPANPICI